MSSVTAVPLHPIKRGSLAKLWIGIALLAAAGLLLAWAGAGRMVGVKVTTVEAGKGPLITANDGVIIDYTGRLAATGKQFETTQGRGPVPMLVGQVIPGFSQALQRMQPGGRYTINIPAKLAYGETPPPGSPIPANSDLEFDIHVLQVVPNAAMMGGAGGPPQGMPPQ